MRENKFVLHFTDEIKNRMVIIYFFCNGMRKMGFLGGGIKFCLIGFDVPYHQNILKIVICSC